MFREPWKPLCAAGLVLGVVACTTGDPRLDGELQPSEPLRMTFLDYRTGARLELVNQSHTDALQLYSTPRTDAARKVQTNELMIDLWDYLRDRDYGSFAIEGEAPPPQSRAYLWSLEVESPHGFSHVREETTLPDDKKEKLRQLSYAFLQTYNATQGWQTVETKPGDIPFKAPRVRGGGSPH